jgi:hypothetical protein
MRPQIRVGGNQAHQTDRSRRRCAEKVEPRITGFDYECSRSARGDERVQPDSLAARRRSREEARAIAHHRRDIATVEG